MLGSIETMKVAFVGLFSGRTKSEVKGVTSSESEPTPNPPTDPNAPKTPQRKTEPTLTRRQAEQRRRERVNPVLSPKEMKRRQAVADRSNRAKAMEARDATPEKMLLRNWVDSRRNLGEFLLPSLIVLLALQLAASVFPDLVWISTGLMYLFIVVVIFDIAVMWSGFKKLLRSRLPNSSPRGLLMYGAMRATQIRRFRMPAPQINRGEKP